MLQFDKYTLDEIFKMADLNLKEGVMRTAGGDLGPFSLDELQTQASNGIDVFVGIDITECRFKEWREYPNNKRYFEDIPFDLPKTGRWKYRIPVNYDKNNKTIKIQNQTYSNVENFSVEDLQKGVFKEGEHFFVTSTGDVWLKGTRPYLNLQVKINWKDSTGNPNITKTKIDADDFMLNGNLISVSDRYVRVPYRPCYEGIEYKYEVYNYVLTTYKKACQADESVVEDMGVYPYKLKPGITAIVNELFDGTPYLFLSSSLDVKKTIVTEYKKQRRTPAVENCECVEFSVITEPTVQRFLTPDCDCSVTVSEEFYTICPDKVTDKAFSQYLAGRITPPTMDELIEKDPLLIEPTYRRLISVNPCDFGDSSSRVFQKFANRDIKQIRTNYIDGMFNGKEYLNCLTTSSLQPTSSKNYYYDITECNECNDTPHFSVAFGHYAGSGSIFESFEDEDSPSRAIFSQHKLSALDYFNDGFTYYNNGEQTSSMYYAIKFYRNTMRDRIDAGNFELNLSELNGLSYSNKFYTGSNVQVSSSNKVLTLIDNSNDLTDILSCEHKNSMKSFDIVSGSLTNGIHSSGVGTYSTNPNIKTYGKVYPSLGLIILDASMLDSELNFNTVTGSNIAGDNSYKIFTSLSGSTSLGYYTRFRNSKQRDMTEYAVRIAPVECNYTNNPTFFKEDGRFRNACFIEHPVTYISTVGLYNSERELLAIAKISKPIKKTLYDTVDIKIRLGR